MVVISRIFSRGYGGLRAAKVLRRLCYIIILSSCLYTTKLEQDLFSIIYMKFLIIETI